MPPYAGFTDLRDYLEVRLASKRISQNELSKQLGWGHTYIGAIAAGDFMPGRARADAIADFFGDDRRIVRILAGLELMHAEENKTLLALRDVAAGLSEANQKELLRYANFLKEKPA